MLVKENSHGKESALSDFLFRLAGSELLGNLLKETGEDSSLKVLDAQLNALDSGEVTLTWC